MPDYTLGLSLSALWLLIVAFSKARVLAPKLREFLESPDRELDPIDEVHRQYIDGKVNESELKEQLEILVDNRARTIRDMTDNADGIGSELSAKLAKEYDTVNELKDAELTEFDDIDGIGEERARSLSREL